MQLHEETESIPQCRSGPVDTLPILDAIQKRVLWLATYSVHYANSIRPNPEGTKVGGHQASSSSLVSLATVLYFHALRPGDRVSVKPHASPVYHAIQALLENLPIEQLKKFRQFQGLQAYPSRTKDPDDVDISTGSVGLGAVATIFGALTQQFVLDHFGHGRQGRYISIVGDAELDEGNVWEALGEECVSQLGNVIWIIDLNRQSLDRVVHPGKARQIEEMFRINGWHLIELKYGSKLESAFARPGGLKLKERIDLMSNGEYQSLLLLDGESIRSKLPGSAGLPWDDDLAELLRPYSAQEVADLLSDLGGHDLGSIIAAFNEAYGITDQPVAIVAYTIKGWRLPFAGDPLNHSLQLSPGQVEELRVALGIPLGEEFSDFPEGSKEQLYIQERRRQFELERRELPPVVRAPTPRIPDSLGQEYQGNLSTQQSFGRILTSLSRLPDIASHIVTASPDVSLSTHLVGWINKMGVYSHQDLPDYFAETPKRGPVQWSQFAKGQHIELGISENTLFLLLTMLGLSQEFTGQVLLPVGTLYDPFICRGLDALIYGAYSNSKFIFAGTPSGISLSPEGGAHQSIMTPSLGMELPHVVYYDLAFAQEVEWVLLAGLRNLLDRQAGRILYLRLSTKPIAQELFPVGGSSPDELALLRQNVLRGGYRLVDRRCHEIYEPGTTVVNLFVTGVMAPECVLASQQLLQRGICANVIHITSPGVVYRGCNQVDRAGMNAPRTRAACHLEQLVPPEERHVPVVTVMDGHSHALSFIGGVFGTKTINLGVDDFGQSGTRQELYDHYQIDEAAIVRAAESALEN